MPLLQGRPSESSLLRQPESSTVGLYAQEAITPSPVIYFNRDKGWDFQDRNLYSRKQWRSGQIPSSHFWARWLHKCLPLLQEHKKWILKQHSLAVNNLVLIVIENVHCGHWLVGWVTKLFPDKDGLVCTAEVKSKNSTLLCLISKLCLLEESN